jgi:hypothetical protein
MIWIEIKNKICGAVPDPQFEAYLTKSPVVFTTPNGVEKRSWVIGPYERLKNLARTLRADAKARAAFGNACFGLRDTDLPPTGSQPAGGFRKPMETATPNPFNPALIAMRQGANPSQVPRRSDQFDVFADFYAKKTLEAHHIVEKSILGEIKRNKGDLQDNIAPCVLVVAELHQQIYTPEVSRFRTSFKSGMSNSAQADLLDSIYKDLYASAQMSDLLQIAKIITGQLRLGKPA